MAEMSERLTVKLGANQRSIVRHIVGLEGHESESDLTRALFKSKAESLGIVWPEENNPKDGTERLKKARKRR
jgi:hypothetical protein